MSDAAQLAELIRSSGPVVALTGAGISVPSGIPDFRSPRTGLWANVDPMEVAHIAVFRRDPARFWGFYGARFAALRGKRPNAAHRALADLERLARERPALAAPLHRTGRAPGLGGLALERFAHPLALAAGAHQSKRTVAPQRRPAVDHGVRIEAHTLEEAPHLVVHVELLSREAPVPGADLVPALEGRDVNVREELGPRRHRGRARPR